MMASDIVIAQRIPTRMQVREGAFAPMLALEARFTCHLCHRTVFVGIPRGAFPWDRQRKMREATEEHRKFCVVPDPELPREGRIFTIDYPRA